MGVFHLAGLGLNPGAVTVPLTHVYFLLRQAKEGDPEAIEFFAHSGEAEERLRGKPEALIIFTSREVISGGKQGDITDMLFHTRKQKNALETIRAYLSHLIRALELQEDTFGKYGLRYLYAVEVKFDDFEDCYRKIYLTMKGLQDKEIHCNLIGGSNQINLSLMLAGSMTGVVGRMYYVFETDTKLMHPSTVGKRKDRIRVPSANWHEIPPLFVSIGEIIERLKALGITEGPVHISCIEKSLDDLGFSKKFIAKLRGTWIAFRNKEMVEAGPLLIKTLELDEELKSKAKEFEGNLSKWKRYFEENGWLYTFIEDGKE